MPPQLRRRLPKAGLVAKLEPRYASRLTTCACITKTLYSVEASLGHLCKLPRELRDQIYLDICEEQNIIMERYRTSPPWKTRYFVDKRSPKEQAHYSVLLNLLLVLRQFSNEVALILYWKRQFRFNNPRDLLHVDRLREKRQRFIINVLLYLAFNANRSTF